MSHWQQLRENRSIESRMSSQVHSRKVLLFSKKIEWKCAHFLEISLLSLRENVELVRRFYGNCFFNKRDKLCRPLWASNLLMGLLRLHIHSIIMNFFLVWRLTTTTKLMAISCEWDKWAHWVLKSKITYNLWFYHSSNSTHRQQS